jgi:cysteine desulfurase
MLYADYNGSVPLLPAVRDYLRRRLDSELFANPNAIHSVGQRLMQGLERARRIVAEAVGCHPDQVLFNSGASEGISTVLYSVLEFSPAKKKVIITSPIEHPAVAKALAYYEREKGYLVKRVHVDGAGRVDVDHLRLLLERHSEELALVAIMAANNETGVLSPYNQIGRACAEARVPFFSDTTQLIGKDAFNFEASGMDYAVCSGHKLGALTGTGFLVAKDPTTLQPLIFGSSQERGLRGGTQNYLGIETVAVAMEDFSTHLDGLKQLRRARLDFEKAIRRQHPKSVIIAEAADRLPGTTLIGYPGLHGQAVQIELESQDIFVTTSAACTDNQPETSEVLRALGVSDDLGRSVVRISFGHRQGEAEYARVLSALSSAYNKLTRIRSY